MEKPKEAVKNKLDTETGFNTRVNLYIIKYLYRKLKKPDGFLEDIKTSTKKHLDISSIINITKPRLNRIINGENYCMPANESEYIAEIFNISKDYFKKNSLLISIHGITPIDWKCYFHQEKGDNIRTLNLSDAEIKDNHTKVDKALKDIIEPSYIPKHYDKEEELYHIYYYFTKGVAYKSDTPINQFLESLTTLKISDWKELTGSPEQLKEYQLLLKKHFEYISACLKIYELQKNE